MRYHHLERSRRDVIRSVGLVAPTLALASGIGSAEGSSISHAKARFMHASWGYGQHFTFECEERTTLTTAHAIEVENTDSGNSFSFSPDEDVELPADVRISLDTHSISRAPRNPRIWLEDDHQCHWNDEAVEETVDAGVASYRIRIGTDDGELLAETGEQEYLNEFTGDLHQDGYSGEMLVSLPRDGLPHDAAVEFSFWEDAEVFDLTYDPAADAFSTSIDSTEYDDGEHGWTVAVSTPHTTELVSLYPSLYREDNYIVIGDELSRLDPYTDDDVIETDGLRRAIDDWRSDDVETDLLREVIDHWRSGDPVDE